MRNNLGFRGWFYFRQGWSVYFAFIFAAVNTLTVTYFLAIENYPVLKDVFPSFIHYVAILVLIGIPLLVLNCNDIDNINSVLVKIRLICGFASM